MLYRFYVGLNHEPSVARRAEIFKRFIAMFGEFTVFNAVGGGRNDEGVMFNEASKVYEVIGDFPPNDIFTIAEYLKEQYTQESVLVVVTEADYNFI